MGSTKTRGPDPPSKPSLPSALVSIVAGSSVPAVLIFAGIKDAFAQRSILICLGVSVLGFVLTLRVIPVVTVYVAKKGLFGYDINKRGTPSGDIKVPESLGLASGVVFLMCAIFFQLLHFTNGSARADEWLLEYNAALASICFMLFLGFVDDVLDIPWRYKLILPMVAALPLAVSYPGGTDIVIPRPLRAYCGGVGILQLGVLYKMYMVLLTVFCTNSINILAGINGLEAGQSLIIAIAVVTHNFMMLLNGDADTTTRDAHLFSAYLMLPFIATTLALLMFNWYPSRVFVGDTFTYFAGMTIAVAGILGHFSETLLLFFLPQLVNFLYSIPQLFKIVPCPRHRLPKLDPDTGLLHPTPNMNLVNLALRICGPMKEEDLCVYLLILQVMCCAAGFAIRYSLEGIWFYK